MESTERNTEVEGGSIISPASCLLTALFWLTSCQKLALLLAIEICRSPRGSINGIMRVHSERVNHKLFHRARAFAYPDQLCALGSFISFQTLKLFDLEIELFENPLCHHAPQMQYSVRVWRRCKLKLYGFYFWLGSLLSLDSTALSDSRCGA